MANTTNVLQEQKYNCPNDLISINNYRNNYNYED